MIESETIRTWRAQRFSWPQIAANLGQTIDAVRSTYDPTYHRPFTAPVIEPPLLVIEPKRGRERQWDIGRLETFVRTLYAAETPVHASTFKFDTRRVVQYFRRHHGSHVLIGIPNRGWVLSADGRRVAEAVYGCG